MYQGYGQPNLNVSTRPQVDPLIFCCEADVYALKRSLCLHVEEAVHRNGERGEVNNLLEVGLQILLILHCFMNTLLWKLVLVGEVVSFL